MSNTEVLLDSAAKEMGIIKGKGESRSQWSMRVVYSAIGRMAYASLWDYSDDEEDASVIHFKSRVTELLTIWRKLYAASIKEFLYNPEELSEYLLKLYSDTGVLYHHPHRLLPAHESMFEINGCVFIRSPMLSRDVLISGLGCYFRSNTLPKNAKETLRFIDPYEAFSIDSHHLGEIADHYIDESHFRGFEGETIDVEFARLTPPFSRGYWKQDPDTSGIVSLMRIKKLPVIFKQEDKPES